MMVSYSAQASIRKYHAQDGLTREICFPIDLETGSPRLRCCWYARIPARALCLSSMTSFPLCPHKAERKPRCLFLLLIRGWVPLWQPTLITSSKPNYLPNASSPNALMVRTLQQFWRDKIQSTADGWEWCFIYLLNKEWSMWLIIQLLFSVRSSSTKLILKLQGAGSQWGKRAMDIGHVWR